MENLKWKFNKTSSMVDERLPIFHHFLTKISISASCLSSPFAGFFSFHPLTDHISSFATLHNFICAFIVCSVSIHRSLIGISTASITFYHHHIGFYSVFLFQITKWELDVTFRYKLSSFYIEIILFKWQLRLAFNLAMRAIKKGFEAIKEKKLINWESFISHFTNKNEKKKFRKKISKKLKSSPF